MKPNFKTIYVQAAIHSNPVWQRNAEAIWQRFPQAERVTVSSHQRIPQLFEADPADWVTTKREQLVLGVRATLRQESNGRSADFIAASFSNGCLSACQYCYVARRKGGSNPLTLFVNLEDISAAIRRHQAKLGPKLAPNQCDPHLWTYDIGCNADLSLDAQVCDFPGRLIEDFAELPYAKATFATKTVNDEYWLQHAPRGHTRLRYSLMPQKVARYVDIGTSPISARIRSANALVAAGYEVHFNFSPIIIYGGDEWRHDWTELLQELDDVLTPETKAQAQCEAFFLTHQAALHETNLRWNPRGEEFLWTPELQVPKKTKPDLLVYDYSMRQRELAWFKAVAARLVPWCPVRYSF